VGRLEDFPGSFVYMKFGCRLHDVSIEPRRLSAFHFVTQMATACRLAGTLELPFMDTQGGDFVNRFQELAACGSVLIGAVLAGGCAAHSPMIVKNTTDTHPVSQSRYPAHHDKVFVTQQPLPSGVAAEELARIDVGKIWYGSSKNVEISMADRARELGANAVVQVKTWHQPSGFSWAAPHGSGVAVRVDPKVLESLSGSWK
jgi:hypothetical protein